MGNEEFVMLLRQAADALEIEKVDWKPRAYRRAAHGIENLRSSLKTIYKEGGRRGLEEIPGVGPAIALHIEEYLKTGKVKKWENLFRKIPKGSTELLNIQGLGPSRIKILEKKLGIRSVAELKAALKKRKLRGVPELGAKLEENLLKSLETYSKSRGRMLLSQATSIASDVLDYLEKNAKVEKAIAAGSLRRMKDTIGDIDILAQSKNPSKSMEAFAKMPSVSRVLAKGSTKTSVLLQRGVQIDLRIVPPEGYGAALIYFTGCKQHNIELRKIAITKGYKLSEYGIYNKKTHKRFLSRTEEEVYRRLGMEYIPPELRTMRGEVPAAQKYSLPNLIEESDIKGDLHMHTTYSDGTESVESMVRAAIARKYKYIAITDHSPSQTIANGLSPERLRLQHKEIDKARKKYGSKIKILKGAEIDILKDGSLDYPNEILRKLDICICAIHSSFQMPEKQMTERICTALENKYLDVWGHPSGRMIGKRPPCAINFSKVFEVAQENKKVLEINSQPVRLDLSDSNVFRARGYNSLFSIDTDAHASSHLDYMRFGVANARRGWLTKNPIVNTYPFSKLKKIFRRISL